MNYPGPMTDTTFLGREYLRRNNSPYSQNKSTVGAPGGNGDIYFMETSSRGSVAYALN